MSTWWSRSSCTRACAVAAGRPVGLPERALRWVALVGALLLMLLGMALAAPLLPDRGRDRLIRFFPRMLLRALGVRLAPSAPRLSAPGRTGTLIAANHISWVDVLAMLAVEPVTFLAKREVAGWPVLGRAVRNAGTRFIHREGLLTLPATVTELGELLRAGRSVAVFAGGTTWCGAPGGPFRRAAFQSAMDADAPVVPLRVWYEQDGRPSTAPAFVAEETILASAARVIRARGLVARVDVLPTLSPEHGRRPADERRRLANATYAAVRDGAIPVRCDALVA